jgi:hypothetical protein
MEAEQALLFICKYKKARRIKEIRDAGLKPIVRVRAARDNRTKALSLL